MGETTAGAAALDLSPSPHADASTELSARRTGMSFQRTRMSADRTLMSVIRTSLSLIGFGFTIAQLFQKLREAGSLVSTGIGPIRNFGTSLVGLGLVMLVVGIAYHLAFMAGLRRERASMKAATLVHGESRFPVSYTVVVALLLLVIGILAVASLLAGGGPFG